MTLTRDEKDLLMLCLGFGCSEFAKAGEVGKMEGVFRLQQKLSHGIKVVSGTPYATVEPERQEGGNKNGKEE